MTPSETQGPDSIISFSTGQRPCLLPFPVLTKHNRILISLPCEQRRPATHFTLPYGTRFKPSQHDLQETPSLGNGAYQLKPSRSLRSSRSINQQASANDEDILACIITPQQQPSSQWNFERVDQRVAVSASAPGTGCKQSLPPERCSGSLPHTFPVWALETYSNLHGSCGWGGVTDSALSWLLSIKRNHTTHSERGWGLVSADKCDALPSVSRADLPFKWGRERGIERDRDITRERERAVHLRLGWGREFLAKTAVLKVWLRAVDVTLRPLSESSALPLASSL